MEETYITLLITSREKGLLVWDFAYQGKMFKAFGLDDKAILKHVKKLISHNGTISVRKTSAKATYQGSD